MIDDHNDKLFTHSYPLGPFIAEEAIDPEQFKRLFDDDNKLVNQLNKEMSLIVGRKGSGKTTLLRSVSLLDQSADVVYLPSDDVFTTIVREIEELSAGVGYVEQVGRLWEFVLWGVVFNNYVGNTGDSELYSFCDALDIVKPDNPYKIINNMLERLRGLPPSAKPLPEKVAYEEIGGTTFLKQKNAITVRLKRERKQFYLLMDSLEDFKTHLPDRRAALAGLLRCVGEFNEGRHSPVVLRCCLPAERYFEYMRISTNPLKDFRGMILLHWDAGELLHLSARRYAKYLEVHCEDFWRNEIKGINLEGRAGVSRFWQKILPPNITNLLGVKEKTMAYVLRHTQLLPRHVIYLLSTILSSSIKNEKKAYGVSEECVRNGIKEAEDLICQQVIEAYDDEQEFVRKICTATLPEFNTVFDRSAFDKIAARVTTKGIPGAYDGIELLETLTEIGALGRVVNSEGLYYQGVFEYMVPHRLIISSRDVLCVHPIFTEVFNVNTDYPDSKPVYTYWSGITNSDLEFWQ